MENIQTVLSSTFFAGAATYFVALCVVLWLIATVAELVEIHPERRREFYKVVFWIIYMFAAVVCGMFVLATRIGSSSELEVLMVLLVADIIVADRLSRAFETMGVKTGGLIRNLKQKFK